MQPNYYPYGYAGYPYQAPSPGALQMVAEKTTPSTGMMNVTTPLAPFVQTINTNAPTLINGTLGYNIVQPQLRKRTIVTGDQDWVGQVRRFGGQPDEDAEEWINEFLMVATANNWNNEQKAAHFRTFLEDVAEQWLNSRPAEIRNNWEKLLKEYKAIFIRQDQTSSFYWHRITSMRQKEGEDVNSIIFELEKAWTHIGAGMTEEAKINALRLIILPKFSDSIIKKHPTTFENACKILRKRQIELQTKEVLQATRSVGMQPPSTIVSNIHAMIPPMGYYPVHSMVPPSTSSSQPATTTVNTISDDATARNSTPNDSLINMVNEIITTRLKETTQQLPPRSDNRTWRGGQRRGPGRRTQPPIRPLGDVNQVDQGSHNDFTQDGRPICNYCHKPGHMRKDCWNRPKSGNDQYVKRSRVNHPDTSINNRQPNNNNNSSSYQRPTSQGNQQQNRNNNRFVNSILDSVLHINDVDSPDT
jgi:hypothetical protein